MKKLLLASVVAGVAVFGSAFTANASLVSQLSFNDNSDLLKVNVGARVVAYLGSNGACSVDTSNNGLGGGGSGAPLIDDDHFIGTGTLQVLSGDGRGFLLFVR